MSCKYIVKARYNVEKRNMYNQKEQKVVICTFEFDKTAEIDRWAMLTDYNDGEWRGPLDTYDVYKITPGIYEYGIFNERKKKQQLLEKTADKLAKTKGL